MRAGIRSGAMRAFFSVPEMLAQVEPVVEKRVEKARLIVSAQSSSAGIGRPGSVERPAPADCGQSNTLGENYKG